MFQTSNEFHGAEIGTIWEGGRCRWTWEFLAKMALGSMHQIVDINGSTVIASPVDAGTTYSGGLLARAPTSAITAPTTWRWFRNLAPRWDTC